MNTNTWACACVHVCKHACVCTHMSVRGLGRTFSPASLAPWLGHPGQQSSDFFLLLPSIPSRLGPSLPLTHLVAAAKFLPLLQYRLLPCLLSAAPTLLITRHLSTSVSAPCAAPTHCNFLPEAPLFPFLSSHPSISLNLASIGHSLPHPWKVQESSCLLFCCASPPWAQLASLPEVYCSIPLDLFRALKGQLATSNQNS